MKHLTKLLLLGVLVAGVLSGCAIPMGPKFTKFDEPKPDVAEIYIIRTRTDKEGPNLGGYFPEITLDRKAIGTLKSRSYLLARVKPGSHYVSTAPNLYWNLKMHVRIDAEGGKRYFIRLDHHGGTWIKKESAFGAPVQTYNAEFYFRQIEENEALPYLKNLSLS